MAAASQSAAMVAAKAALIEILQASEDLEGVQVSWSHPGKAIERKTVIVGNCRAGEQKQVSKGRGRREATFRIEVEANVLRRDEPAAAAEDAAELGAAVEAAVGANPELGRPGTILFAEISSAELLEGPADKEREAVVGLEVAVRARILSA